MAREKWVETEVGRRACQPSDAPQAGKGETIKLGGVFASGEEATLLPVERELFHLVDAKINFSFLNASKAVFILNQAGLAQWTYHRWSLSPCAVCGLGLLHRVSALQLFTCQVS